MFKDMTPEALVEAYHSTRVLLATASALNANRQVIRLADRLDLIVNVARKRGISLR